MAPTRLCQVSNHPNASYAEAAAVELVHTVRAEPKPDGQKTATRGACFSAVQFQSEWNGPWEAVAEAGEAAGWWENAGSTEEQWAAMLEAMSLLAKQFPLIKRQLEGSCLCCGDPKHTATQCPSSQAASAAAPTPPRASSVNTPRTSKGPAAAKRPVPAKALKPRARQLEREPGEIPRRKPTSGDRVKLLKAAAEADGGTLDPEEAKRTRFGGDREALPSRSKEARAAERVRAKDRATAATAASAGRGGRGGRGGRAAAAAL